MRLWNNKRVPRTQRSGIQYAQAHIIFVQLESRGITANNLTENAVVWKGFLALGSASGRRNDGGEGWNGNRREGAKMRIENGQSPSLHIPQSFFVVAKPFPDSSFHTPNVPFPPSHLIYPPCPTPLDLTSSEVPPSLSHPYPGPNHHPSRFASRVSPPAIARASPPPPRRKGLLAYSLALSRLPVKKP